MQAHTICKAEGLSLDDGLKNLHYIHQKRFDEMIDTGWHNFGHMHYVQPQLKVVSISIFLASYFDS
jgi:hypothetical protein